MWVGAVLSVIIELVPESLRNTGVGLYFFIINNIGGNMQILLPPVQKIIKKRFNLTRELDSFRGMFKKNIASQQIFFSCNNNLKFNFSWKLINWI